MPELPQEEYRYPDHWLLHEKDPDGLFTLLHTAYVNRVIDILKAAGAQTVLDVGCGDGWNTGAMLKAGLSAIGTDFVQRAINYSRMFVPGGSFICGDLTSAEFKAAHPEKFDAVTLIEVIEHIAPERCAGALRNIADPLKPGGTLVLTTPSENFPNTNDYHYQHFTPEKLKALAGEAGLVVQAIEGYGDMAADSAHWSRMRWVDNRLYSIKPLAAKLVEQYKRSISLTRTPLDRCKGLIMTLTKQ